MTDELTMLRNADPSRPQQAFVELDERARSDLKAITEAARASRKSPHRGAWRWGAGIAAAAITAIVALGLPGGTPTPRAFAATPALLPVTSMPAEPGDVLNDLAHRATLAAASAPSATQTIRTQSWSLFTRVNGKTVDSAVVPLESELRWNADRSGSLKTLTGQPYFPDKASKQAWADAGQPARPGTVLTNQTYSAGQFAPMWSTAPPTDPQAIANYLTVGHPIAQNGTAELFVAIADLAHERELSSSQRAAILHTLAKASDLHTMGTVIDRLGRPGVAVATDSAYSGLMTRYLLVFDPTTGALNAEEAWLTTSAGKLNVPVPSVISYTVWRH